MVRKIHSVVRDAVGVSVPERERERGMYLCVTHQDEHDCPDLNLDATKTRLKQVLLTVPLFQLQANSRIYDEPKNRKFGHECPTTAVETLCLTACIDDSSSTFCNLFVNLSPLFLVSRNDS